MTTIPLALIRPSPHPVRTSWDEDRLNELAASIAEQGVIVPVKVRKVGDTPCTCGYEGDWNKWYADSNTVERFDETARLERCKWCEWMWQGNGEETDEQIAAWESWPPCFELVYGHRRAEAARRAGLTEIPAIVEGVDDTQALIQALIENVQREDMEPMDTARALRALMNATGWSLREIERYGIMSGRRAGGLVRLLDEPDDIQRLVTRGQPGPGGTPHGRVSPEHVENVRQAGVRDDLARQTLYKAAGEGLTIPQTRRVAEAVAAAPNDAVRKTLLDAPYSPYTHDAESVRNEPELYQDNIIRPADADWRAAPGVAELLAWVRDAGRAVDRFRTGTMLAKPAPEHKPYIVKRLRALSASLGEWADELERTFNKEASNG